MDKQTSLLCGWTSLGGIIGYIRSRLIVSDLCNTNVGDIQYDQCESGTYGEGLIEISSNQAQFNRSELIEMVYVPEILSGLVIGFFLGCIILGLIQTRENEKLDGIKSNNLQSKMSQKNLESRKVRCRHFDEKGKRCDNYFNSLHDKNPYCDEHKDQERDKIFRLPKEPENEPIPNKKRPPKPKNKLEK